MIDCEQLQTPLLVSPVALIKLHRRARSRVAWTEFGSVGVGRRAALGQNDKSSEGSGHPGLDPVGSRSLPLIRGSFERAQRALNVSCYKFKFSNLNPGQDTRAKYSLTGLVSKSVSALASVHPQSMRHGGKQGPGPCLLGPLRPQGLGAGRSFAKFVSKFAMLCIFPLREISCEI
jgi:hypothetical protein